MSWRSLTPEQIKAYRSADNKTSELSDWNYDKDRPLANDFLARPTVELTPP